MEELRKEAEKPERSDHREARKVVQDATMQEVAAGHLQLERMESIVWDTLTTNKVNAIPLKSSWVVTCAYAPSGNMVACGGLDKMCSSTTSRARAPAMSRSCVSWHTGVICPAVVSLAAVRSSLTPETACVLWDIETGTQKTILKRVTWETAVLAVSRTQAFISGGLRLHGPNSWDIRGHLPTGVQRPTRVTSTPSGSSRTAMRSLRVRTAPPVSCTTQGRTRASHLQDSSIMCVTSWPVPLRPADTGRIRLNFNVNIWDSLKGERVGVLAGHDNRVSCLESPRTEWRAAQDLGQLLKIWN
ncbi:hypothetical protein DPEC_G00361960 [Dallia pectoralis]|nr:hypothetical protein DPEC_G00361960 [Dallia pectoralis]